jgi:hypothetical protein
LASHLGAYAADILILNVGDANKTAASLPARGVALIVTASAQKDSNASSAGSARETETSLYDLWLIARGHPRLIIALPALALVAVLAACVLQPPRYGYTCLIEAPQLAHPGSLLVTHVEEPRNTREWLLFRYEERPIGSDPESELRDVRILNEQNLIEIEVWAATLADAEAGCTHVLEALQGRYASKVARFVDRQNAIVAAIEREIEAQKTLLEKLAGSDLSAMKPVLQTVFAMERERIQARLERLSVEVEEQRYAIDPDGTFNFRSLAMKPVDEGPVYPRTLAMTAIGTLAALVVALLVSLLIESFRAASTGRG